MTTYHIICPWEIHAVTDSGLEVFQSGEYIANPDDCDQTLERVLDLIHQHDRIIRIEEREQLSSCQWRHTDASESVAQSWWADRCQHYCSVTNSFIPDFVRKFCPGLDDELAAIDADVDQPQRVLGRTMG